MERLRMNNTQTQKSIDVSLNIGVLSVNFHKETTEHVKSSEYFIA